MDLATALFYPYVLQQQQQPLHYNRSHNEDDDKSKRNFVSSSSILSNESFCFEYIPVVIPSNDQQHINNNKNNETTSRRNETYNNYNQIHKNHLPNQQQQQRHYQLSYQNMIQNIYQQHQLYLNHYCRSLHRNSNHYYDQQQQQPQVAVPILSSTITSSCPIVVAYIANNSIDYLISILAAVSSGSTGTHRDTTICRTSNIKHCRNVDQQQQQQQYNRHEYCIQLLPVLIPTKWTVSEIVQVLQVPSTNVNHDDTTSIHIRASTSNQQKEQHHVTLIVYDSHFQSIAEQVQDQLQQQQQQQKHTISSNHKQEKHIIQCIPLPSYGHDFIINNTNIRLPPSTSSSLQNKFTSNAYDTNCTNIILNNTNNPSITSSIVHYSNVSDQDAIIVFTSGTTSGISVGVRISHRALYIQCYMKYIHCFTNDKDTTSSSTTGTDITSSPPCLLASTVPLYHIGGICNYLATWYCGGTIMMPLPTIITPNQQIGHVHISQSSITASHNISFDPSIIFQCLMYHSDSHPPLSSTFNHVNTLVVVPTMIHMLEQYYINNIHNGKNSNIFPSNIIFPHVQNILVGGQSITKTQIQFLNQIFPNVQIIQTYACTEATSSITYHNISKITKKPLNSQYTSSATNVVSNINDAHVTNNKKTLMTIGQCVGHPPSQISVFLCKMHQEDEEENREEDIEKSNSTNSNQNNTYIPTVQQPIIITTPYTPGIIVTSGPHIMNGYWTLRGRRQRKTTATNNYNNSHSNKKKHEYVITNDIGYWDEDNNLYYVGRRNTDTIRTGGETVWCTEVEQIIQQHSNIIECSVFGILDNTYGEVVCCAIVVDTIGSVYSSSNAKTEMITIDTIRKWCGQMGLAGYKRPRHILIYDKASQHQQQNHDSTITGTESSNTTLPRNSNGKVLKYRLQQTLKELLQMKKNEFNNDMTTSSKSNNNVRLLSKL